MAATSALTLEYTESGTLTLITAAGTTFRSTTTPGAVISPGQYQVIFNNDMPDSHDIQHQFRFQGPGVNLQTDLAAGDNKTELYDVVLAPSATYVYADDRQPNLARITVTTASSASVAAGSTTTSHGAPSSGTSTNSSIAGSDIKKHPFRGKLAAVVGGSGKLTLTAGGSPITRLLSGRYAITVSDRTARGGFTVQHAGKKAIALTGAAFVGTRTVTVTFTVGGWTFYSASGKKRTFTVLN
jgi:hypothetical protein